MLYLRLEAGAKVINMAEERQEKLPPLYSAKDVEITVWNRVLEQLTAMGKEGITTINEDYSKIWQEEVRKIVAQIQQRDARNREKLQKWIPKKEA